MSLLPFAVQRRYQRRVSRGLHPPHDGRRERLPPHRQGSPLAWGRLQSRTLRRSNCAHGRIRWAHHTPIYIYIYIHTYTCLHAYTHTHIHTHFMSIFLYRVNSLMAASGKHHTRLYIKYTYTFLPAYKHVYIHTHFIFIFLYRVNPRMSASGAHTTHDYIYIYIHIHIHACTLTHMYIYTTHDYI